jgi:subtilisin-like proprotein convertase family protein
MGVDISWHATARQRRPKVHKALLSAAICFVIVAVSAPLPDHATASETPNWIPFAQGDQTAEATAKVIGETADNVVIEIAVPGFSAREIAARAGSFSDLEIPGCGRTTAIGKAALPILRRAVEIPQGADPTIEILEYKSSRFQLADLELPDRIYPAQPPIEKVPGAREAAEFKISDTFYRSSKAYPDFRARIQETGQIRGHRFAMLEVAPITYLPADGEIEVLTSIRVRINMPGADRAGTKTTIDRYASPRFEQAASRMLLNYEPPSAKAVPDSQVGYLIITDSEFYSEMQTLAEWKSTKGYRTTVTRTSDIPGGATTTSIKAYISDAWQDWDVPPTFVLLVGDVADIPNWTGTETDNPPTDLYYVTMTEPDYIPDIGIGRLSVTSPTEAAALVGKIVEYEKRLFGTTSWLKKAVFMASEDNYTITEETHNYVISNYFDPAGYAYDKLYCHTYSATTQQVRDAFNDGRGIAIYSGHGATTYWADGPQFTQSDVAGLTNLDMYPFVQSYACVTGDYTVSECFAETWIREIDKAGVGFWASSVTSYWDEDDVLEKGVCKALFVDGLTWISGMTDQGKWYLYEYYGGAGSTKRYYEMYNLQGDPSLDVWTDTPATMTVSHAGTCPVGAASYTVHVEDGSGPLADALACLDMSGEVYETGYTDADGDVLLTLDPAPSHTGQMYLTVTCHNFEPVFDTIEVVVPAVVTVDPDTIYVQTPTLVTVTVVDTLSLPMENVVVAIDGWGLNPALLDTTDSAGEAAIIVDAPYGETLTVTGREIGETYDCFQEPLVVVGGIALADPEIEARADVVGLMGALTPGLPGTITGRADHTGLDMYAAGCGVAGFVSSAADSAVLEVTPTGLGEVTVALTYPGYDVYTGMVPVIEAYGTLAGAVTDASSGDSLPGALVSGYPADADTAVIPPVFETTSQGDGTYATPDSISVGLYDIYAAKFGYLASAGSTLVRVGANSHDIEMTQAPSGTVSGTVTEEGTARPITATIEIYRSDDMSLYSQTTSDSLAGGAYSTDPLPYFTYRFRIRAQHYVTRQIDVTVDETTEIVNIQLTPTMGNLLVIDDAAGTRTFETKFGPKGEPILFDGERVTEGDEPKSATLIAQDLESLGYDVTTETAASTDPGTWGNYDVVVWSAGDNTSPVASSSYRSGLNAYVRGLGRLLIEGGEIGYDAASSPGYPNFADTTLHIVSWQHDSSGNLAVALPAHPIASSPNALPATMAMTYSGYGDQDALLPDAETEVVFDWSSYSGQGGVLVYDDTPDPGSAQIVYYSFDYANITDTESRKSLLENTIVHLLAEESTPDGSVSGRVELAGEADYEGVIVRTSPMGLADTTDESGYYMIEGLYDATYQVTASKDGFSDSTVTVEIVGGGAVGDVDFTLYPVLEYMADPEIAIPDYNPTGIRVYLDVPADAALASVDCYVDITHSFKGDLVVELTSPEGTTVRLHNRTGSSANDIVTWYDAETEPDGPGTMADFAGEWAEGQWELYVADMASIDTGTLHSWGLHLAFPPEASGVEEISAGIPAVHFLERSSPNPFTTLTSLRFGLPTDEEVRLTLYSVDGRKVTTLASGRYPAGIHTASWDGSDSGGNRVASGIYFCRFTAGTFKATRRIVYMR